MRIELKAERQQINKKRVDRDLQEVRHGGLAAIRIKRSIDL
jgi:hypothetical protein